MDRLSGETKLLFLLERTDKYMIKIVAFIFDLSHGGAQGVLVNVCNYLNSLENVMVEVVVQNLDNPVYKKELDTNIQVTSFEVSSARKMLKPLKKYLNRNEFDYAFAFSPEIAVNLVLARKSTKKNFKIVGRCINTLSIEFKHTKSFFRKYITNNLIKRYYSYVDIAVAQSQGMASDLEKNFNFNEKQIMVINNAMNPLFEAEARETEKKNLKDNYILYVGRLEQQKGLTFLLDSFRMLEDKDVMLYLVGNGSQREMLNELSVQYGINERVKFVEYTRDVMEYYKRAKITVLSSYFEGFPNVLVESIACGTPVVSFDLPSGPSEIIIIGKNGYLVDYLDSQQLAKKIDEALINKWDESVIKNTSMRYSKDNIMSKYRNLFMYNDKCLLENEEIKSSE